MSADLTPDMQAEVGYFDASHLVRQFKGAMSQTPREFRERSKRALSAPE